MSRVLLITGATGIAEATALKASAEGDSVFVVSRDEDECRSLCERLPAAAWFACDLRDEEKVQAAFCACLRRFRTVHAVFNVAGISGRAFGDGPVHECSIQGWETTIDTNLLSTFLMCRCVLRHWVENNAPGVILNMSSVLAFSPQAEHFATHAYAASKGAIIALSRSMAAYYAPRGIRVNVIAPGLVRTRMSLRAQSDPAISQYIRAKQPLSDGMLDRQDIADAALFLLSDASGRMTGQVLAVDGGWSVSG
jgi:NAD(P)-dependent dehydrogenase (short-subunit alcohol dehydrogenase family)